MDPLKLLTRGIKLPKNAAKSAPAQRLPSSGEASNPQIYGRSTVEKNIAVPTQQTSAKKRKRGQNVLEQPVFIPAELDFFKDGSGQAHKPSTETTQDGAHTKHVQLFAANGLDDDQDDSSNGASVGAELMDEEERRRILKEHKIKVAVLEDFQVSERQKHKERKKRKRNNEPEPSKKKHKTQLYPQPLTSFFQLRSRYGISRALEENIAAQGFKVPSEVQLASVPLLLGAREDIGISEAAESYSAKTDTIPDIDLLTVAPTGSGKTLAFLVPVITALMRERRSQTEEGASQSGTKAIIIAPTKELANQIVNEGRKLTLRTGIKITLMKKGMQLAAVRYDADIETNSEGEPHTASEQSDNSDGQLKTPNVKADIIVSTPLTLLNSLKKKKHDQIELPEIKHLILDEADVLLDQLFRKQTEEIWDACNHPALRVSLWSATMGSSIEELTVNTIKTRHTGTHPAQKRPIVRLVVGLKDTALPTIAHKLTYAATEQGKLMALRQLLRPATSTKESGPSLRPPFIVFTQTIPRAVALHSELKYDIPPEAGGSARIAVLHSSLSDTAREDVMKRFRLGEIWVLITTDLLARGVDFRGVNGVVNYDVPTSAAAYVHRVGRTGRAGREGGVAVTLYAKEDIPFIKGVANVIAASEKMKTGSSKNNEVAVPQWLLDSLPTPSKRDKQRLKQRGVEERRAGLGQIKDAKMKRAARISTKSGYERKLENRRRGAVEASKRAKEVEVEEDEGSEDDFEGFAE